MKTQILITTALCSAVAFSCSNKEAKKEQKNIILIMADDLGWGDVGFNGNTIIKTPNLDKLAGEGVIFERFYTSSAVSSPTRFGVVTGRNPYRNGVFTANAGILRCEEQTLSEIVKEHGYTSGHFGKWHLGSLTDKERDANRGKVGNSGEFNPPSLHGYDDSFVTESKVPTYDPMLSPENVDGKFWDYIKADDNAVAFGTSYWRHDGTKETENLRGDDSRVIMDRVIPFIDGAKNNDKPFLAEVWFHAPHLPCVAGPKEHEMYKDYPLDKRNFYGCITAMDEQVGRLVKYLKDNDLFDNTIIYFCSDNGPEGGDSAPGTTGGLTGRKRSLHEGGIRVPAFVVCPDLIEGGKTTSLPLFTADYLPTIVDLLGAKTPQYRLDGESMLEAISGDDVENAKRKRPMIFLIKNQCAVIDNQYKLHYDTGKYSLFDITNDRAEQHDIIEQHPEIAQQYKAILMEHLDSYEGTFNGEEYPFVKKIEQKWTTPLIH
ncbi:MAG: sulfatase-like hydrolase/transferase [Rikenellaceae bacterium]